MERGGGYWKEERGRGGGSRVAFDNIRPLCDQRLLLNCCPGHAVVEKKDLADTLAGGKASRHHEWLASWKI